MTHCDGARAAPYVLATLAALSIAVALAAAPALADNTRLNASVINNVYTVQHRSGCTGDLTPNASLRLAAQRCADDLINSVDPASVGPDGVAGAGPAADAGFHGRVAQTVAINPALAISSLEVINQWFANPDALAVMRDCGFSRIEDWSENAVTRSVVVAVLGQPSPYAHPLMKGLQACSSRTWSAE